MPRNDQVARIFAIFEMLAGAPQGLTVHDLHSRVIERGYKSSTRNIYRDLDALQKAGFPIAQNRSGSGDEAGSRWSVDRSTRINQYLVLSPAELLALYLARGILTPLRETCFYRDLSEFFSKIENKISESGRQYITELESELHFDPWPKWSPGISPELLDTLRSGCFERQVLAIEYSSVNSHERRTRRVGPHCLYFSKGAMYLVGEDLETNVIKTFAVSRITRAELLNEPYDTTPVDPEEFFKSSFGTYRSAESVRVRIEFNREVASFIAERIWHSSQKVIRHEDGSITVEMDVALTPELVGWVLGFGAGARVLEPRELEASVVEAARDLLQRYLEEGAA